MGGARAQVNKAHKTRYASKSTRNVHKISEKDKPRGSKSERNVLNGARAARLQRNKTLRDQKRTALLNEKRTLSGSSSPPRTIVLFGLSATVDVSSLEHDLLASLSPGTGGELFPTVVSSEHKLRFTVLKAPYGDLQSCMEMAKVADLIAFVASANGEGTSGYIDSFGDHCLSVFRSIGLPSTVVLLRDLPSDLKSRQELKKDCTTNLSAEFPEDCKFHLADTKDDILKFVRLMKDQRPVIPHWRNQRSYIAASKVDLVQDESEPGKCTLLLSGYVRARNLSVNQLVHVSGAGDFQLCKIEILKDPFPLNQRKGHNMMDAEEANDVQVIQSLVPESSRQEPLLVENVPDPLAGEQTWPTEAEMADAEKNEKQKIPKKRSVPLGTSDYQAAWILDDTDEDASECDNDDVDDGMMLDMVQSGIPSGDVKDFESDEDQDPLELREYDTETENDSVMMDGENMTREQIEDDLRKLKEAHADDEEFPDEVDTPLDVPARRRFAKYRGLKSFRTSSWDPKESLPCEYGRIFEFGNFAKTKKKVLAEALELEQASKECASVGSYVRIHVKEVPTSVASKICTRANSVPVITCGLFQHESKMSVLHFSIKKHDSYTEPIKSKEELVFHVGFRQFVARPVFSSDNFNSDKSKMEKFLHAGRFSMASVYAPILFSSLPLIAMKKTDSGASVVAAVGTLRSVDPNRIVLKKIILTGYPQRVSKVKATVRYMFHNPEDVKWFKPVEVYTKAGRRGRVKEPVGTHGAMKCIFNGVLQQNDTVCMTLYKRSYPKFVDSPYAILD